MSIHEPLSHFCDNEDLRFYLINCGSGLMHLIIFPDETVMLFDCNVTNDQEEEIIGFLEKHIPLRYDSDSGKEEQYIDVFVNSHRDEDHYRGLKKINNRFKIKSIWDSGQSGQSTTSNDYNYYMYLRRELKKKSTDNLLVPTPTDSVFKSFGEADIYCLAAEADFEESTEVSYKLESAAKIQHTNSMVLLVVFKGRKLLLTGDSDWKSWKEQIVSNFSDKDINYEDTDILIASHHGSRSFFTDEECIDVESYPDTTYIESIEMISPVITLISCADYEYKNYHLPNKEAMDLYKQFTSGGIQQIHTTHKEGTLCGFIDKFGNFGVVPYRFKKRMPAGDKRFYLKCCKVKDNIATVIQSGSEVEIGYQLKFSIIGLGDIINTTDKIDVWWQVCNVGMESDYEHKEIYYKAKDEADEKYAFSRELSYKGKHLLRCRVINKQKRFDGTLVFVVEGV